MDIRGVLVPKCEELQSRECIRYISRDDEDAMHYCSNEDCIAQRFQRVKHFIKVMGIKGLGDSMLAKLMVGRIYPWSS